MVTLSNKEKAILTENDYYQKGVTYETVIDAKQRTRALGSQFVVQLDSQTCQVTIADTTVVDSVILTAMRFNDAAQDQRYALRKISSDVWSCDSFLPNRGKWQVKVSAFFKSHLWFFYESEYFKE